MGVAAVARIAVSRRAERGCRLKAGLLTYSRLKCKAAYGRIGFRGSSEGHGSAVAVGIAESSVAGCLALPCGSRL